MVNTVFLDIEPHAIKSAIYAFVAEKDGKHSICGMMLNGTPTPMISATLEGMDRYRDAVFAMQMQSSTQINLVRFVRMNLPHCQDSVDLDL